MSRKKKKKKPRLSVDRQPSAFNTSDEPRASVAATVAWMLTALCTAVAELLALGAFLLSLGAPPSETPDPLLLVSHTMLWIAFITGLVTLGLTIVVYRVRQTPPPRAITAFATIIGLIPPVILIVTIFR